MKGIKEHALLLGGIVLAVAGAALAAAHDPIPGFLEWGTVALLGGAVGVTVPAAVKSTTPASSPAPAADEPAVVRALDAAAAAAGHAHNARATLAEAQALGRDLRSLLANANPQVAHPYPTPGRAEKTALGPAEGVAVPGVAP